MQFAGAVMIVPLIIVLSLKKMFEPSTVGTLVGVIIGFLLAGIAEGEGAEKP